LRNWKFLRFCKQGNKQGSFASGHKSGGLVSVLASGLFAHPKNARDLTVYKTTTRHARVRESLGLIENI
jgi:hypothetical protein